ncbi:MAG: hypothetical protein EOM77_04455 [Bacteroidia bacterium]|nr:hypothetical protein [Bacteroidia bacterium]
MEKREINNLYYLDKAISVALNFEDNELYDIVKIDPDLPDDAYAKKAYYLPDGVFGYGAEAKKRRIAVGKSAILWIIRQAAKNGERIDFECRFAQENLFAHKSRQFWGDYGDYRQEVLIATQKDKDETIDGLQSRIEHLKNQIQVVKEKIKKLMEEE